MSDQHKPKIGEIIEDCLLVEKDAIHVPILPATAGERIMPGALVGINNAGYAVNEARGIGVADPFIKRAIERDENFYLWLRPGTVKNLRHDWDHPVLEGIKDSRAFERAEIAIKEFAGILDVSLEELLEAAEESTDGSLYFSRDIYYPADTQVAEFWRAHKAVYGSKIEVTSLNTGCSC